MMAVYLVTTLAYSFFLKRVAILDVMTLTFLFLIRVAAGGAIVAQELSPWLTCFILTFFLSLSLIKRYVELVKSAAVNKTSIAGRGYGVADKNLVLGFGMMATAMTLISFILYGVVSDIPALKTKLSVLIVGTIITYWVMRLWLLAHRTQLNDDPAIFAVKDRLSIVAGALIFSIVAIERLGGF